MHEELNPQIVNPFNQHYPILWKEKGHETKYFNPTCFNILSSCWL